MVGYIFSADSHVIEPPDLWVTRIDEEYRDRAPRMIQEEPQDGAKAFLSSSVDRFWCEDAVPTTVPSFFMGHHDLFDKPGDAYTVEANRGWAAAPPSLFDPAERLKEQDIDGIAGELLFPSMAMMLHLTKDLGLQDASCRAFNDWVTEYASYDVNRLVPIGILPDDPELAVREIERSRSIGLRGAFIRGAFREDAPYSHPMYDRLWAAAVVADLPLTVHDLVLRGKVSFNGADYIALPQESQLLIADIVLGGVFERFPRLRLVSAENDVSWLPHLMFRMDHKQQKFGSAEKLPCKPSEYCQRNLWASTVFENEVLEMTAQFLPASHLMWGSDYPHPDGTYPHSAKILADFYTRITPQEKQHIVGQSVVELYGVDASFLPAA